MRLSSLGSCGSAGRSFGHRCGCTRAVVAGLRGVEADIPITDLHQLTKLLGQVENPRA